MAELVIDISHWDGDINLDEWKRKHGLWGVIIKAGGNERGLGRYADPKFERHYRVAKEAGLHIGYYYYTVSTDTGNAFDDARHFANIIGGKDYDLPCYMDVEDPGQFALSPNALTKVITTFCDTLIECGYYAGLYISGSNWLNSVNTDELTKYANWIAWWQAEWPSAAGDIGMWQQGTMRLSDGDIRFADVSGYTDLDWCCVDYPSRINGGQNQKPDPEPTIPVQTVSPPLNDYGFYYRAHGQQAGWYPPVRDGQVAGSEGYSARLEAFKFRPTEAMGELDVDIHMQGIGWKSYTGIKAGEHSSTDSSDIDPICGTVGESRRIEAIKLVLRGNTTGKKLRYMGHVQGIGWMNAVWEGEVCGTTGESKRLEAVRIWLDDPNNPIDISDLVTQSQEAPSSDQRTYGRASDVINAAYGELGYYAPDDPEQGSKYGRWLADLTGEDWLAGPSWEIFWCCMFASWCLDQGGVEMDGFPTQNTDEALRGGARKYNIDDFTDVQYGDVIIFNWNWDSATDHIGFATGEFDGYGFPTIEGNVGNAVQEKYRQLANVQYILRPPYNGYGVVGGNTPSVSTDPKNNRDGGTLDIDGIGGYNTIIDWQNQLGTYEDGEINGQDRDNQKWFPNIYNVTWEEDGSPLVKAIQRKVGVDDDGIWGHDTSAGIQSYLVDLGYSVGDNGISGCFDSDSVKALQRSLNDGAWK